MKGDFFFCWSFSIFCISIIYDNIIIDYIIYKENINRIGMQCTVEMARKSWDLKMMKNIYVKVLRKIKNKT